ncbi:MAG: 2-dehydropantoate 2-reductase [Armatimonadota bacterium]|nr:2-dehydropantoate 2-reductase [Armatimonadota bacterium]MDR7467714.1 2-dehydropantoate 2-reductase [Armatimonadota bacterium]MDR7499821.1 2-dehydropantoate 2-reductase [Armatimonadota bacterium]MDR7505233.1 2-dehydropantoate 2-reductase [Armatimonadota bacterium]MDR7573947.1 2-dehydropantoate 2-reductase [Armatimonadota bacterium]
MHFTVIGAGAIGGTAGALLARAGHDVLFVDQDAAHIRAINAGGLTIEGRQTFTVRAPAVTPAALAAAVGARIPEAVLLCVKAMHTRAALEPVVPLLGPQNFVVSLQNGLNEEVIASLVGAERTVGAFVNFGADYLEPGRVMFGGEGALYLGELDGRLTPRLERLTRIFQDAVLPETTATANIWGYLWGKLGYGAILFATALVDEAIADVLAHAPVRPALANLAGEAVAVARAQGIRCEAFDGFEPERFAFRRPRDWAGIHASLDRLVEFNRRSLKAKSGVWRDLAVRRRQTEVDEIVGAVVRKAERYGIRAPLHRRLQELIHDLEAGRRTMSWDNLAVLAAISAAEYPES